LSGLEVALLPASPAARAAISSSLLSSVGPAFFFWMYWLSSLRTCVQELAPWAPLGDRLDPEVAHTATTRRMYCCCARRFAVRGWPREALEIAVAGCYGFGERTGRSLSAERPKAAGSKQHP
jgi:hypothetical protein